MRVIPVYQNVQKAIECIGLNGHYFSELLQLKRQLKHECSIRVYKR